MKAFRIGRPFFMLTDAGFLSGLIFATISSIQYPVSSIQPLTYCPIAPFALSLPRETVFEIFSPVFFQPCFVALQ